MNSDDLGSPIGAAIVVLCRPSAEPAAHYFLLGASNRVIIAAAISGAALFVGVALLSLFSAKTLGLALAHAAIGAVPAAATYGIGSLFNVSTSGAFF